MFAIYGHPIQDIYFHEMFGPKKALNIDQIKSNCVHLFAYWVNIKGILNTKTNILTYISVIDPILSYRSYLYRSCNRYVYYMSNISFGVCWVYIIIV